MKLRNVAFSLSLCALLLGSTPAKAVAENNPPLQVKSVYSQFDKNTYNFKITVEALGDVSSLEDEVDICYISQEPGNILEKEIKLSLSNGKYEGIVRAEELKGKWQPSFLIIRGKDKNVNVVYNSKVHNGLGTDLSSADLNGEEVPKDNVAPKIEDLEVQQIYDEIKISLTASDDISGLSDEATLGYIMAYGEKVVEKEYSLKLNNGVYQCREKLPEEKGLWKVSFITLEDRTKNVSVVYNSKVHNGLGQDLSIGDINTSKLIEDNTLPVYKNMEVSIKDGKAYISLSASDEVSGLSDTASISYILDRGNTILEKDVELKLVDGKYRGNLDLKDMNGLWKVSYLTLEDKAKNVMVVYNSDVHKGLGIDLSAGNIKNFETKMVIESLNSKDDFKLGKDGVVKVRVSNYTSIKKDATLIVGVYTANNGMLESYSEGRTIEAGTNTEFKCTVKIPEAGVYIIRAFVWDSIDGMIPIGDAIEFEVDK